LFVDPTYRAGGMGRAVMRELISHAQAHGMHRLVLNTLPTMTHAVEMYRSIGFTPAAPYIENPTEGVLFFELALPAS
jgi:ribosomal protein S18 acetylase RimI-like enzyme